VIHDVQATGPGGEFYARTTDSPELDATVLDAIELDTFDTAVCHMAFFTDPDGNDLMLHSRYAPQT
jgi:hypothetical protein